MKLPHKAIWVDLGFGEEYSVIIAAKLSKPIQANKVVLTILDTEIIKNKTLPKQERIVKLQGLINKFKIKYEIPDEFIQKISS